MGPVPVAILLGMTAAPAPLVLPPDKREARRVVRARRREWAAAHLHHQQGEAMARHGLDLVRRTGARTVTAYVAWESEPPTAALLRSLRAEGVRVLVPVTLEDLELDWVELLEMPQGDVVAEADLVLGDRLGLHGIARADLVLTPGLAVDRGGMRLGQGGGCYDRALPRRRAGVPVVTLLHEHELVERVPCEAHDLPVDGVLRACGLTTFTG